MQTQTVEYLFAAGAVTFVIIGILGAAFFTVQQRTTVIAKRLGKFLREAGPGLHTKIPFADKVVDGPVTSMLRPEDSPEGARKDRTCVHAP